MQVAKNALLYIEQKQIQNPEDALASQEDTVIFNKPTLTSTSRSNSTFELGGNRKRVGETLNEVNFEKSLEKLHAVSVQKT